MNYVSTRGQALSLDFGDVLLAGMASDGGLYVPTELAPAQLPSRSGSAGDTDAPGVPGWAESPGGGGSGYAAMAAAVMWPFVEGSIDRETFGRLVDDAYATFTHPDIVPLVELGEGLWLLELFHGPTLAFKDVALQLVGRLFDFELTRRGERATIVVATSGDTGSAAIAACVQRPTLDVVVLHPAGRVSEVQRRQMTTVDAPNVHNLAIEGTFDDCQDLVKACFADEALRRDTSLAAMNSINWARVMAQIVYYFWAAEQLGPRVDRGEEGLGFSVPTGNFGNVLAGWYAGQMGLPITELVVASNRNDILTRWLATGTLETRDVIPTISPSMDIQISSNLERLIFELEDRDGAKVAELMTKFRATGCVETGRDPLFTGARLDDDATRAVIADVFEHTGKMIDPHTAVGVGAARVIRAHDNHSPMVCLATAHPAKFPDAVEQATGERPELPDVLAGLADLPEHYDTLPDDLGRVKAFIRRVAGAEVGPDAGAAGRSA